MADIIRLLPDSVANQIAAGEVIQRPASVVKELVENSIDAGATNIQIIIKDAGRTLVQVIDNGTGMSATDARMAFERHATSKIQNADDLFSIRTMGFRGEALASIAAVAQVELKTKSANQELGTYIQIAGSNVVEQKPVHCSDGSSLSVKNLFFNIPARRKFLKSDQTEFKHILSEFIKIAFANLNVNFSLIHSDSEIYNLPADNLKKRITQILGKSYNQNLINLNIQSSIVKIWGYIGKPEFSRKSSAEQYFFANNRFMRHPYFHKAVIAAYENLLPHESVPDYFIFFEIDPKTIDINIHPTKTEIKFEDAPSIFQILRVAVKEALGKFNIVPAIDFDTEGMVTIPRFDKDAEIVAPSIEIDNNYNPFSSFEKVSNKSLDDQNLKNWEKLYSGFENEEKHNNKPKPDEQNINADLLNSRKFFQLKNKYILTSVKSGLMIVDQRRAHERILFEKFIDQIKNQIMPSFIQLYPVQLEFSAYDYLNVTELMPDLRYVGFDIEEFGLNTVVIRGTPADINVDDPAELLKSIIDHYKNSSADIKIQGHEEIARLMAKKTAIQYGQSLTDFEMQNIIDQLFACTIPNHTADGKTIIHIISNDEIDKKF